MSSELDKETVLTPATTDHSKEIRPINKETVHKICSGQVNSEYQNIIKNFVLTLSVITGCSKFGSCCKRTRRKCY